MKKMVALLLAVCFLFAGCEESHGVNEVQMTFNSSSCSGKHYEQVIELFRELGFTNIKTVKIEDMVLGIFYFDGEVASVTVGGKTKFRKGDWLDTTNLVVIEYHTYANYDDDDNDSDDNKGDNSNDNTN